MRRLLALFALLAAPALADGEPAGEFDYYVLALSWSPSWCALEGDARGSPQCADGTGFGFVLHGLWPQYEAGWPSYCRGPHPEATRAQTAAMADIMGTAGSAWHQWKKHGHCSGLTAGDYFRLARLAFDGVTRPAELRALGRPVTLPAEVVEAAFLEANPGLSDEGVTVTCRDRRVQEVRICLTRALEPRACAPDAARDCGLRDALLLPVR
ncbi:ribonuclease T2 family protein [Jannaschia formosa]|uniref:ribonuclease T2 family protein n=1 Tax=Jannaschia formosa TaxID=2259592 RepID=UPI000E1B909A|nr:ribonuclease T2 [Jannaschia formosa]TFL17744.1 ribonuclease T [Jannaschia formosa]